MSSEVSKYRIKRLSEYSGLQKYTTYEPKEVGSFSIDKDGNFINCNKAKIPTLKDFAGSLPLDLNEGYDSGSVDTSRETSFPQWEKGLKWIQGSDDGYQRLFDVDVVTQRGVLKDIGYTNHNRYKNPWKFEACKFDGRMYIRKVEEEENWDEWGLRNSYWGKRFEEYVMEQEVGVKATYRMVKGNIGKRNVLLSAELDAVTADGRLMEMKTCFPNKLEAKIPLAWLQSHLGGIEVLYYGLKDKKGIVSRMPTEIDMSQVPGRYVHAHEANAMIGFLGHVLDWMYTKLPDSNETWVLEYGGCAEISLHKKGGEFLPSWYLDFIGGRKEDDLVRKVEALNLEHPVS